MATLSETSLGMQITIGQVSKLESFYTSEVLVHGIPWKVQIFKDFTANDDSHDGDNEEDNSWLAVRLICANNDKSLKWSIAGAASFKLLPFSYGTNVLESNCTPMIFNQNSLAGIDFCSLIRWKDLFDKNNSYVKDDAIKLEIKIEAENPNDPNRSSVQLKRVEKGCDCGSSVTFRLIVKNISNLLAVRAPRFELRGLSWNIVVGRKASTDTLFAQLYFDEPTKEVSCPLTWFIKILSSKADVNPIEKIQAESELRTTGFLTLAASWKVLCKPENGYVNNDFIELEVEIVTCKLRGEGAKDLPAAKRDKFNPDDDTEFLKLECPICLKCISGQNLAVTPCGHMFCFACIRNAVTSRSACPVCNKAFRSYSLRQIYLPIVN